MDTLTKRQLKLINFLIREKDYKTINNFATLLNTSSKTIQKDLDEIEKYLEKFNIVLNRKRGL